MCGINEDNIITIDFLGDICLAWYEKDGESLHGLAEAINNKLNNVDYRIANLENPICNEFNQPIIKSGPNLRIDYNTADSIIPILNIDAYSLANNHMGDYGVGGITETCNYISKIGKRCFGIEKSSDGYTPLIISAKGKRIGFISICENEFGTSTDKIKGTAGYQPENLIKSVKTVKQDTDYCFVIFHGGIEHYPFPTPLQKKRYRMIIDAGADGVIGMHSHCPVGYEYYLEKPILYGLGNFFFPRKEGAFFESWNYGYVARLLLGRSIEFECIPYFFNDKGTDFELIDSNYFNNYCKENSLIINNDDDIKSIFNTWCFLNREKHFGYLGKIDCRSTNYERIALIKNLFSCESHNEVFINTLNMCLVDSAREGIDLKAYNLLKEYMNIKQKIGLLKGDVNINDMDTYLFWGCNSLGARKCKEVKGNNVNVLFVDKDAIKQGLYFQGKKVISPEDAVSQYQNAFYYVCVSKKNENEVTSFLRNNHIPQDRIITI